MLQVGEEEGRQLDSVISDLRALADTGLFARRSHLDHEQTLPQRRVVDLSGRGDRGDQGA